MDFPASRRYLLELGHETAAMKLGIENTRRLLALLGDPQTSYRKIQIAGTNGKGSTAAMLASICSASGLRTGLYTSPHLISLTERIRTEGAEIDEDVFALHTTEVRAAAERVFAETHARPTFFEQITAIALVAFRAQQIEFAILETGLGGRLDSVTAADAEMAAITLIDFDHQEYLGATLTEIAGEKAAIIRRGCEIAFTAAQSMEARSVIERRATRCGVELREAIGMIKTHEAFALGRLRVTIKTPRATYADVRLALRGRHQAANALLAVSIAEAIAERDPRITPDVIRRGLETASHPGRLELFEQTGGAPVLLDGAHNAAGASALAEFMREFVSAPVTLLFGAMADKDLTSIARTLFPLAVRVVLTRVDNPRSASAETLIDLMRFANDESRDPTTRCFDHARDALAHARHVTPHDGLVLVTGSLYLVGEIVGLLRDETSPQT